MEIKTYYVDGYGYGSKPHNSQGDEIWDEVEVVLSKEEFERFLTPKGEK